jgi:alkylhydroperoxidase family enzyme
MNKPVKPPPPRMLVEAQPFIPYVKDEDFDSRLRPVVEPYKKRMGFLPNALKLYAYRPEIAETLWRLNSNVMRDPSSALDQFLKRKLAVVCCAINGCAYCTAHSCSMLKKPRGNDFEGWGMDEAELQAIITGTFQPKNEFERVCFDYVRAASEDPTAVPDEILNRLKQHLTPPQIVELACVVGFWKFYNTVHDSLRIPVESQLLEDTGYVDLEV